MTIFLYTNKDCEYQAISCIRSILPRIDDRTRIVYYTIDFNSTFEAKNLVKIKVGKRNYPTFHYYKAELALMTMDMFPDETDFIFTDTDVLFSRRFNPISMIHTLTYPLASRGPHEFPFIYENLGLPNETVFNELKLMDYFNVKDRTMRYLWSCFFIFNKGCRDFIEEYTSMCKNEYLLARRKWYFPFHDETPFNVCLWKRFANENLGHIFLNTHIPEHVKLVEENKITDQRLGKNVDICGNDWEYINDSDKIVLYHGFKEKTHMEQALQYLLQ